MPQVLDSKNRPCLTERALLSNLAAIVHDADKTPPNQVAAAAIGVLSTERRATWAGHRATLMKERGNALCLDVLDKALFVVCLDDTAPESASELCSSMLCGTYKLDKGVQTGTSVNRFYDKVSCLDEGVGGWCGSAADGGGFVAGAAANHCRCEWGGRDQL